MKIVPNIPLPKRGFATTVPVAGVVNEVLHELKTVAHWEQLPVRSLFSEKALSRQSVYYRYLKRCLNDTFFFCWTPLLEKHEDKLDLSSINLGGSHTPALIGVEEEEYQVPKKRKTTNALYFTERQGLSSVMSEPVADNHNCIFDIEVQFELVAATLEQAGICAKSLFLNADAGFDSKSFGAVSASNDIKANIFFNKRNGDISDRDEHFDKSLYNERYAVEKTNSWLDSFPVSVE